MAGNEDDIPDEIRPSTLEVGKRDGEVYFAGARIATDFKAVALLFCVLEITFMEGAVVVHSELGISGQKVGKRAERVVCGR